MSWDCPHQSNSGADCDRLGKPCKPLSRGCVLYGTSDLLGGCPLRVNVLQHVSFEGLGSIADWLAARVNTRVTFVRLYRGEALPPVDSADLIIALGGPMSVNDEALFSWLREEKRFLSEAITNGTPVLGICLGAQLIASALGASVYPGPEKEIGWFPVFAEPAQPEAFNFPAESTVFHWHGETFDLPQGAIHLASSAVCRHQAFQVGPRAIGLQFHLETTPASAEAMLTHCADELRSQPFIQSEQELRRAPAERYSAINALMANVLDYLVAADR